MTGVKVHVLRVRGVLGEASTALTVVLPAVHAEDEARCDCAAVQQALGMLPGAARKVVGHTNQDAGINAACGQRVYRIDVGLSKGCGNGEPEVGREPPCCFPCLE